MRGTRPMPLSPDGYARALVEEVPELEKLARIDTRILCNLDSSDLGPEEWLVLAQEISAARATHDGVVVVHGTDTMAYTACGLAFALPGLDRPVVLTGSQRPLAAIRTDARRNLVDAVDLATRDIPEVGICFDGALLRGVRASKGSAWAYAAFTSPRCPPLARLGLDVEIGAHVRRPAEPFRNEARFDRRVAVLWVFPGLPQGALLQACVEARALVLVAFGVGTVPVAAGRVVDEVAELVGRGVTVTVVTQAQAGAVDLSLYQNGARLAEAGALSGGDMTVEAAVVKSMFALGHWPDDPDARRAFLLRNVAGELGGQAACHQLHVIT
jgi:L-asparaginase